MGANEEMLINAAISGDSNLIEVAIGKGADLEAEEHFGRTAILLASSNGHTYL